MWSNGGGDHPKEMEVELMVVMVNPSGGAVGGFSVVLKLPVELLTDP
jgi:hypothetical protein